jgi:hypothetical protein
LQLVRVGPFRCHELFALVVQADGDIVVGTFGVWWIVCLRSGI